MPELPPDRELRRVTSEYRWVADAHGSTVRFYLGINVALAAASLALLKIEGPFFGDAIAAALFVCGFMTCLLGVRAIRDSEAQVRALADRRIALEHKCGLREGEPQALPSGARGLTIVLVCFAVFHLASAVATVWLTYISPVEAPADVDSVAAIVHLAVCLRFCR
jgi:hypothetical protein